MKTTTFDASGNPTNTTDTAASAGGGGSGKSIIAKGYYWPSSGAYPTSMTPNREMVSDGSQVATVTQGDGAAGAGTVVSISGFVYGSTGGQPYTWTLYKNGTATGLTCSVTSANAAPATSSNTTVPFVAGDVLQVYSMAASGATAQATKASLTVTLT